MQRMRDRAGIDGVILGGTELPLILRDVPFSLPLLDTTRIHVDAALRAAAPS
jgi:aspartate racemase